MFRIADHRHDDPFRRGAIQSRRGLLGILGRCGRLARFLRHRRGAVAPTFAVALIPIFAAVGIAVDYSVASKVKTSLNAAADAAALAAVSKNQMSTSAKDAKKNANKAFKQEAADVKGASLDKVSIKVQDSGGSRTAVVSYKASVPTAFMGLAGIDSISLAGSSTATSGLPTYVDFYLLLDNSPSMGVGATTADINTLVANTPDKCAFACHDLSAAPNDYYGLAKKLGVQMRIDVVRQATQRLMDTAQDTRSSSDQFRVAIYTFGASAESAGLTTIQALTSNLGKARNAAANIDLMTVPYQNYASDTDTNFGDVLTGLNAAVSTPGNGATAATPLKYMFFVSDGVADRALGSPACAKSTTAGSDPKTGKSYNRCQEPLDPAFCATMKKRGVKIAVLYTTYLPLPTNAWYNDWIAPWQGQIATRMQDCASPGLYFEVSPTQGISDAMTALFQKMVQQARLTK
jgi:Flp pilus assembly protein TadG